MVQNRQKGKAQPLYLFGIILNFLENYTWYYKVNMTFREISD